MFKNISKALKRFGTSCRAVATATPVGRIYTARRTKQLWAEFHSQNPTLVEYTKPYRAPRDLAHKWKSQGLSIRHRKFAERVIFRENYFRFKAYAIPFFDKTTNKFIPGTDFDDINGLYCADQKLRDFLLPLVAQLEVRTRAIVDNVVTSATNDPFWYLNPEYFKNFSDVERALKKAQQRFEQGKQEFVVHYRARYYTGKSYVYRRTPPFWILSEIFTLEQLVSICKSLNEKCPRFVVSAGSNKLDAAATPFGLNAYGALVANLHCLLELRNLCAHHTRLWNRNLRAPGGLKGKYTLNPSHPNRLYSHLLLLRTYCKAQGISDGIKPFMVNMFATIPVFSRDMASMGFPANWDTDTIWT